MKFGLAVIYLYKDGPSPNMGINFASGVFGEVIIKLTYHVKPRGVFSISSGTIRLIRANQEFDTGNICVENWLTICNNLLMDHQQHYWYIKNSSRALQNIRTIQSSYWISCSDWLAAAELSHWSTEARSDWESNGRQGASGMFEFLVAACKVNLTRWEPSPSWEPEYS